MGGAEAQNGQGTATESLGKRHQRRRLSFFEKSAQKRWANDLVFHCVVSCRHGGTGVRAGTNQGRARLSGLRGYLFEGRKNTTTLYFYCGFFTLLSFEIRMLAILPIGVGNGCHRKTDNRRNSLTENPLRRILWRVTQTRNDMNPLFFSLRRKKSSSRFARRKQGCVLRQSRKCVGCHACQTKQKLSAKPRIGISLGFDLLEELVQGP